MIGDRELSRLRQEHYAVLAQVFAAAAGEELLEVLARDLLTRARGAAQMDLALSEGWRALRDLFGEGGASAWAERCEDEYVRLFVGPGVPEATPCESYYRSGKLYAEPLGWVRDFMREAGLEPTAETSEAEDHIAFELEIMRTLIAKQEAAGDSEGEARWLGLQGKFLRRHLEAWAPDFFRDLEANEAVPFYAAMAKVGRGFLAWEGRILAPWGPSAEEVEPPRPERPGGEWKGPLFDPEVSGPPPEILGDRGE